MIAFVFSICFICVNSLQQIDTPNLKTVLFNENDLTKRCWLQADVNLLAARRVMQDIIPNKIPRNYHILLDYLKNATRLINQTAPEGKPREIQMTALDDVIGSYLQAIVLPMANEAYYAGEVEYETVAELHDMLDNIKNRLNTDGSAWLQQIDMQKVSTKVTPLQINVYQPDLACGALFVAPKKNESNMFDQLSMNSDTILTETSRVAIPYLDNTVEPNAVAIPLKVQNLFSLSNPSSKYILVRYYSIVMRCLGRESAEDILAFNHLFHQWIITKVVPHLHDKDRWYPGFGGVMRIIETMNQRNLASPIDSVYVVPPPFQQPAEQPKESMMEIKIEEEPFCKLPFLTDFNFTSYSNLIFLLLLLGISAAASIILCCCFCYVCKCCQPKKQNFNYIDVNEKESFTAHRPNPVLSIYYGLMDNFMKKKPSDISNEFKTRPTGKKPKLQKQPKYVLNNVQIQKPKTNATSISDIPYALEVSDSDDTTSNEEM